MASCDAENTRPSLPARPVVGASSNATVSVQRVEDVKPKERFERHTPTSLRLPAIALHNYRLLLYRPRYIRSNPMPSTSQELTTPMMKEDSLPKSRLPLMPDWGYRPRRNAVLFL